MYGNKHNHFSPRRYELVELVDWFHRVMRKDENYGYMSYDMKWDPFFKVKAMITEYCPSWPVNTLTRDKVERVRELFSFYFNFFLQKYGSVSL